MGFEDSPKLEDYQNGIPERQEPWLSIHGRMRWILLALAAISALVWITTLARSGIIAVETGTGEVVGVVVDDLNQPIQAEVFLLSGAPETLADRDGKFVLSDVPAGSQTLIVARDITAVALEIQVKQHETLDLGIIQLEATPIP